ncbi:MAG TPA: alpha/beta fold hydrolase [Burkholderiaceae bacterium]|nr:alpha/beta fold hydrolase [Burkholderiaceae bacterium]HQR70781.1 alpha/beta fold hydrolase [Burkholderiaceae bacterium]
MEFNRRTVTVNGVELNVIVEGQGPDVLLVHGFPDDHTVWRHQIPALVAAGYRVIAPDTRGCGESSIPECTSDYRIDLLVADLVGVLDALGIQKVRLVGHDWGAVQAWQLAIRHPERVERYVALSVGHPEAYAHGGLMQKLKGYYIALIQLRGVIERVVRLFNWWPMRAMVNFAAEFPQIRNRLSRPGRLTAGFSYYRANLGMLFPPRYPRVKVPVVGIYSDGDRFLTERQMRNSQRYCDAGWRFVRLEGANHWLQLDAPERANLLLLEHLA